jgi:hypothetical protein
MQQAICTLARCESSYASNATTLARCVAAGRRAAQQTHEPGPRESHPAAQPSVGTGRPFCRRHLARALRSLVSCPNPSHGFVPRRHLKVADPPPPISLYPQESRDRRVRNLKRQALFSLSPPCARAALLKSRRRLFRSRSRLAPWSAAVAPSLPAVKNRFGEFVVSLRCRRAATRRLSWAQAQDRDAGRCGTRAGCMFSKVRGRT